MSVRRKEEAGEKFSYWGRFIIIKLNHKFQFRFKGVYDLCKFAIRETNFFPLNLYSITKKMQIYCIPLQYFA